MSLDPTNITTFITTYGFPIVAFLLIYMDLRNKIEAMTKAMMEWRESNKVIFDTLTICLTNINEALKELTKK